MRYNHKRLISLISERKIVPFLGAGFSMPSGVPSWRELTNGLINTLSHSDSILISNLRERIGEPELSEIIGILNLSELPVLEYITEQINNVRIEPSVYHQLISQMPFDTIVTTNWDLLIENQYSFEKIPFNVIHRNNDIVNYNPQHKVQILKIHGSIHDPKSLVYRKANYDSYFKDRKLFLALLTTLMATKNFLFVGYGIGDKNIIDILRYLKTSLGSVTKEHFALIYDESSANAWHELGIETILCPGFVKNENNYYSSTYRFLSELHEATQTKAVTNIGRAKLVNNILEKVIAKNSIKPVLYMRGTLGWLSNPLPISGDPIYGEIVQDIEERKMTELLVQFLKKNSQNLIKNILHINSETSLKELYKPQHIKRRLETLKELLIQFPNQIIVAHDSIPRYFNQMIFDEYSSLVGYKTISSFGIRRVVTSKDKATLRNDIQTFNADFADILEANKVSAQRLGIDISQLDWQNTFIISLLNIELEKIDEVDVNSSESNCLFQKDAKLFSEALLFAINSHERTEQKREDNITPFYIHLIRVIERIRAIGKIENYEVLCAAALHDVVEDCNISLELIKSHFGESVCLYVKEITKLENQTEFEYLDQIQSSSLNTKIIKLADKWDNIAELREKKYPSFGGILPSEYLNNAKLILEICKDANQQLALGLLKEIEECELDFNNQND